MPTKPQAKKPREAKYLVELDDLEQVIRKTLNRIHGRDGKRIFNEVTDCLLAGITIKIEMTSGRRGVPWAVNELEASSHNSAGRPSARLALPINVTTAAQRTRQRGAHGVDVGFTE
jgi:hypothetical protein